MILIKYTECMVTRGVTQARCWYYDIVRNPLGRHEVEQLIFSHNRVLPIFSILRRQCLGLLVFTYIRQSRQQSFHIYMADFW